MINMKKLMMIFLIFSSLFGFSQSVEEIKKEISGSCKIDENGNVYYQKIIESNDKSKDEIFTIIQSYFTYFYGGDARKVIQLKDKEKGLLLAKGYYVVRGNLNNNTATIAYHVIKAEIKDNKTRITITLTQYEVPPSVVFGIVNNISETCPISPNFNNKKWWARTFYIAHNSVMSSFKEIENSLKTKDENW